MLRPAWAANTDSLRALRDKCHMLPQPSQVRQAMKSAIHSRAGRPNIALDAVKRPESDATMDRQSTPISETGLDSRRRGNAGLSTAGIGCKPAAHEPFEGNTAEFHIAEAWFIASHNRVEMPRRRM